MGLKTRLYLFALVAVTMMSIVSSSYLHRTLQVAYEDLLHEALLQKADLIARALVRLDEQSGEKSWDMDEEVDAFGAMAGARITVISETGRVIADSELDGDELNSVENHGERPEVLAARASGLGQSRRYSTTIGSYMLYVATSRGPDGTVIRVGAPTSAVERALSQLRLVLFIAAGLGLLVAVGVGALASHNATRTLRSLVESARAIGEKGRGRLDYSSKDELGDLAGSVNQLAAELEQKVKWLGEERDRLDTILRGTSEGILALDHDKKVRLVNKGAIELLSLPNDVEGRPIYEVTREPDLLLLTERGSSQTASAEIRTRDSSRILLGRVDPLSATGGAVLVLHDVTEMRRLEKMRREFVANASHELRTPISIIRANAETLLERGGLDNEEFREKFLDAIRRNATRLELLISDLLDLSRIEAERREVHLRSLLVRDVVERVTTLLSRRATESRVSVLIEVGPEESIVADEKALEQILVNLVENAIKYSDQPDGHVWIRTEVTGERMKILVDDEGPGIPEAARTRIFERFYRVDAGRSRELGGTGLGLAIVKHLAQMLGGEVSVTPRSPRGSRFCVDLPRLRKGKGSEAVPAT